MAYCHFELCRDCGLGCFSELLLADIRRLSVVAVVFLYQITVFYNITQQHYFWNFILMTQCKLCTRAAAAVAVNKERSPMGRCSIYRHRSEADRIVGSDWKTTGWRTGRRVRAMAHRLARPCHTDDCPLPGLDVGKCVFFV